jgi:epoxyqueuosine reductase
MNGLIFKEPYGSYLFIGTILSDMSFNETEAAASGCLGCGRCVDACPTKALSLRDGKSVFDRTRCISRLTQKKGALTEDEREIVRNSGYIWGCDVCADVCPYNAEPLMTDINGFL